MSFLDGLDIQSAKGETPSSPTPSKGGFLSGLDVKPLTEKPTPVPSPYFYGTDKQGDTFGASDQTDSSGKPFLGYRAPGDTATTTDKTRVATTFDPRVPQKLDSKTFLTPRAVADRATLKSALGGSYSDELDHTIALELSGSNDPSNLIIEPGRTDGGTASQHDVLETSLAKAVASGQKSLFDAQAELAKAKGQKLPFTGPTKQNFLEKLWGKVKSALTPTKAEAETSQPGDNSGDKGFLAGLKIEAPSAPSFKLNQSPITKPGVGATDTSTQAVPDETTPDIKKLFSGESQVRLPFGTKNQTAPVEGGAITGITTDLVSRLMEALPKAVSVTAANLKGAGELARGGTEKPLQLSFDASRLGLPEGHAVADSGTRMVNDFNARMDKDPSAPKTNAFLSILSGPVQDVFDATIAGDTLESSAELVLKKTGFGAPALASLRSLDINPTEFRGLDAEEAQAYVSQRGTAKIQAIVERSRDVLEKHGVLPEEAQREINQVAKDVADIGTAYFHAPKPNLGNFAQSLRDLADTLTKPLDQAEPGFGVPHPEAEKIPGYRREAGQPHPAGLSTERVEPVGFGDKVTKPEPFQGFQDISTNVIDKLEGRSEVSKQFISDLTNSPDLKQPEREVIRQALSDYPEGKPVPVKEFADKVHAELLPLDRETVVKDTMRAGQQQLGGKYEQVSLPSTERGKVENYSEHVYTSPIETSAGDIHFGDISLGEKTGKDTRNYFGHTRVEDLPDSTRRVIEVQSDLYQKGRLEEEGTAFGAMKGDDSILKIAKRTGETTEEVVNRLTKEAQNKIKPLQQYSNPTAHFRMVREEVKQAAKDGKTKLQFPTGETAMKIEGLGQGGDSFAIKIGNNWNDGGLTEDLFKSGKAKVGSQITNAQGDWIITDVLGDGKFKAVPNRIYEDWAVEKRGEAYLREYSETFDISGKVDTSNPIYKFYEKDLGRYLKSKYGASLITDKQGVKWWEVPVSKEAATKPVSAFKRTLSRGSTANIEEIKKLLFQNIPENRVRLIFDSSTLPFGTSGRYTPVRPEMRGILKPMIELLTAKGKVSVSTAFHESYHYIFDNFLSKAEQSEALALAKKEIGPIQRGGYRLFGYKTERDILEEYLADQYAEAKTTESGYKTSPFAKLFATLDRILKKIKDTVKEIGARFEAIPNRQGGFVKNPLAEEPDEVRPNFKEQEAANKERNKVLNKEESVPQVSATEKKVEELSLQKEHLGLILEDHPAKDLVKYVSNETGELPEVAGGKTSKFGQRGDVINEAAMRYNDLDQANEGVKDYKATRERFIAVSKELSKARKTLAEERVATKDEKSLNHFLNKKQTPAEHAIVLRDRLERIKRATEEGAVKAQQEAAYKDAFQAKIKQAHLEAAKGKGIFRQIKDWLFPADSLDPVTKGIVTDWFEKKLVAKELAQEAFKETIPKGPQNFQEIIDYQAGKQTPYIRDTFDALQTEAKRRGLEFAYIDNYLPQVWQNNSRDQSLAINQYLKAKGMTDEEIKNYLAGDKLPESKSLRLKLRPNFAKERFWPDYETGMKHGLKPKFRTPAQLVAYYRQEMENSIANRELIQELKAEAKLLPPEDAPDTWKILTKRFSFGQVYAAPPELADLINGKFRDEDNLTPLQKIAKGASVVGTGAQRIQLSAGIPFTNINFHSVGQLYKALNTGLGELGIAAFKAPYNALRGVKGLPIEVQNAISSFKISAAFIRSNSTARSIAWFDRNQKYIALMAKNDIDVSGHLGHYQNLYRNFSDLFPVPKEDTQLGRLKAKAIGTKNVLGLGFKQAFGEKTFNSFMPMIHVQLFKDAFEGALRDGLPEEEASKFAAELIRNYDGIVREVGRSNTAKQTLTGLLYAQPYRESLINSFLKTGPAWTTEFKNPDYSKSRALLLGAVITLAMYNLLNKKLNGHYLWQNPPGHELQLRIPRANGDVMYIDYFPGTALVRNLIEGTFALAKGDTKTAGGKFVSTFALPLQITGQLISNLDYFGRPIYKDSDSLAVKTAKGAAYAGLGVDNPFIRDSYMAWAGQEPLYQALTRMAAMPVKFGSKSKEGTAIAIAHKNQIGSLFLDLQQMKADGKTDEANKIYFALPPADQKIYNTYKAQGKAATTKALYAPTRVIFDENQRLKANGRTNEAQAIYQALPAAQQKIYDIIKEEANLSQ